MLHVSYTHFKAMKCVCLLLKQVLPMAEILSSTLEKNVQVLF